MVEVYFDSWWGIGCRNFLWKCVCLVVWRSGYIVGIDVEWICLDLFVRCSVINIIFEILENLKIDEIISVWIVYLLRRLICKCLDWDCNCEYGVVVFVMFGKFNINVVEVIMVYIMFFIVIFVWFFFIFLYLREF